MATRPPLCALPHEMVLAVGSHIRHEKDLFAWSVATGVALDDVVIDHLAWKVRHYSLPRLVRTRIPARVLDRAMRRAGIIPWVGLIVPAAQAGRIGIVEWLCDIAFSTADPVQDDPLAKARPRVRTALYSAINQANLARVDVLACLFAQADRWNICITRKTLLLLLARSARGGHAGAFNIVHQRLAAPSMGPGHCQSADPIFPRLVTHDMASTIERLCALGCGCVPRLDDIVLGAAIADGAVDTAKFIADVLANEHPRGEVRIDAHYAEAAAKRGHLSTVALAHDRGLCACSVHILNAAGYRGRLDILRWAAGETRPDGRPIEAWARSMPDRDVTALLATPEGVLLAWWAYVSWRN